MAANTSTYGIPYNCKNWLALASVIWGNLDTSEAIKIVGGKGCGLPKKVLEIYRITLLSNAS